MLVGMLTLIFFDLQRWIVAYSEMTMSRADAKQGIGIPANQASDSALAGLGALCCLLAATFAARCIENEILMHLLLAKKS